MASPDSILSSFNRNHVRSTSLPTSSHPIIQRVEENLNQLRHEWESSPRSPSTSSSLCGGLSGLTQLYESVEEYLLHLTQSQKTFSRHGHKKGVEDEVLDCSLQLLDSFGMTRDITMEMIDALKDLQLALRRRRGEESISTTAYVSLRKKAVKCLKALRRTSECSGSSSPSGDGSHDVVITVLREARSISITVLESLLSFISISKPRSARKSFFIKWGGSGRIAPDVDEEKMNEMEELGASLTALNRPKSERETKQLVMEKTHEKLKAALVTMQGLEDALDNLQRRLIQTRVSLLNLLSH